MWERRVDVRVYNDERNVYNIDISVQERVKRFATERDEESNI